MTELQYIYAMTVYSTIYLSNPSKGLPRIQSISQLSYVEHHPLQLARPFPLSQIQKVSAISVMIPPSPLEFSNHAHPQLEHWSCPHEEQGGYAIYPTIVTAPH
jgi:hypothetical protein